MYSLDVRVVRQRVLAKLTTDTALLVPTERNLGVDRVRAVDPCSTGVQAVCNFECTVDIL